MSFNNATTRVLEFPYQAKSPTLKKVITFDEAELWREVDRILAEDTERKYTVGTNLYYNMLLCSDINYWLDQDTQLYLEEFMAMKQFNIPLSSNIDDTDYHRFVIFSGIYEEYNACIESQSKKKNG
tara:strand:+ start:805 stop:1182 length:378 start_codon:yes stop_codon:yes gene_type:complete